MITVRIPDDGDARLRFRATDPALAFAAPEDGTYRLLVRDLYASGQGEARFFYLLVSGPASPISA